MTTPCTNSQHSIHSSSFVSGFQCSLKPEVKQEQNKVVTGRVAARPRITPVCSSSPVQQPGSRVLTDYAFLTYFKQYHMRLCTERGQGMKDKITDLKYLYLFLVYQTIGLSTLYNNERIQLRNFFQLVVFKYGCLIKIFKSSITLNTNPVQSSCFPFANRNKNSHLKQLEPWRKHS